MRGEPNISDPRINFLSESKSRKHKDSQALGLMHTAKSPRRDKSSRRKHIYPINEVEPTQLVAVVDVSSSSDELERMLGLSLKGLV